MMPIPDPRCIFCGSRSGPFTRAEHPIPESLGNDDVILDPGLVCDSCNQYFGSKVESVVLANPPFNVERTAFAVPSKKGTVPFIKADGFSLHSTGMANRLWVVGYGDLSKADEVFSDGFILRPPEHRSLDDYWARFFLKMGLELLVKAAGIDVYSATFDPARRCARFGDGVKAWDVAYGIYPKRQDLLISTREDDRGRLETHQIYQHEMGVMADGDVVLSFVYAQHVFACNLTRPSLAEYLRGFNALNEFKLESRLASRS